MKPLLENLFEGVYVMDENGVIIFWNKSAESITGFSKDDVLGKKCSEGILVHLDESCSLNCPINCKAKEAMNSRNNTCADLYFHHKNGYRLLVKTKLMPVYSENGKSEGCVQIFKEKYSWGNEKRRIEELEKMSLSDHLTGIGNRKLAEIGIDTALHRLKRYSLKFGVVFADIDDFKKINDEFGHATGDRVLIMVAKTISGNLRNGGLACRWGGDEFVLIIENTDDDLLNVLAERTRKLVENSFLIIDGKIISVTLSAGATEASPDDSVTTLVERADRLMFQSKKLGKNIVTKDFNIKNSQELKNP